MAKKGGGGKTGKGGGTNAPVKSPNVGHGKGIGAHKGNVAGAQAAKGNRNQPGGKKPGKHAGEVYNPGERNPTIDPFLTGEDIMAYSQARSQYEGQLNELDYGYEQAQINTQREKEGITKREGYELSGAKEDFAARGLQRSSTRDADLYDISATAEMKKANLDTNLTTLKTHTETEKERLRSAWEDPEEGYLHGLDLKKVANAQAAGGEMGEWAKEPGWEKKPGGGGNKNKPNKPKQGGGKKFATGGPVPNPSQPPPKPTKTGGTQYPVNNPGVYGKHKASGIKGKNYG
jgi:hypothetical protein